MRELSYILANVISEVSWDCLTHVHWNVLFFKIKFLHSLLSVYKSTSYKSSFVLWSFIKYCWGFKCIIRSNWRQAPLIIAICWLKLWISTVSSLARAKAEWTIIEGSKGSTVRRAIGRQLSNLIFKAFSVGFIKTDLLFTCFILNWFLWRIFFENTSLARSTFSAILVPILNSASLVPVVIYFCFKRASLHRSLFGWWRRFFSLLLSLRIGGYTYPAPSLFHL